MLILFSLNKFGLGLSPEPRLILRENLSFASSSNVCFNSNSLFFLNSSSLHYNAVLVTKVVSMGNFAAASLNASLATSSGTPSISYNTLPG